MTTKEKKIEALTDGAMTVSEAARFLALCSDVVHDLMDAGEIDYVDYSKPTSKRRVRRPTRKSVMEYAASRVVLATAEA